MDNTALENKWEQMVRANNEREIAICLVVIDIDNFKGVNDTYGHAQGDNVLLALTDIIKRHCSE